MSAVAPAGIDRAPLLRLGAAVRSATRSDAAMAVAVAAWCVLLAAVTWGTWGDPTMDTGYDMLAASRSAGGELPYVDYVYFYGPLAPLLLGGLYAVTGPSVGAAAGLGIVLSGCIVALAYRLARCFAGPLPAALAAALTATAAFAGANNSYVIPHTLSAPLSIALALVAVLALVTHARSDDAGLRNPLIAGVAAGLVCITRPELAVALGFALVVWLGIGVLRERAWRDAVAVLAPAAAIPLVVYGAFLAQGVGLRELLFDNLYPRDYLDAAGHVILDGHAPRTLSSVVELVGRTLGYAVLVAAMLVGARMIAAGGTLRRLALTAAALAALAFLAVLAVKPETVRFYLQWAYAWIPLGAWLAVAWLVWRTRGTNRRPAALLPALLLAAIATTTYASFLPFPNALFPEATAYAMPVAAVFLVWLHCRALPDAAGRGRAAAATLGAAWLALLVLASAGLVVHDARQETSTVSGNHGALTARPADGPALQQALDAVERLTRPGEPVLIAPQLTWLYVAADRPDPLPQLSLLPGSLATAADEERAIEQMRDVRLVVVDREPLTLYEHGSFGTTFNPRLADWLQTDFRRLSTFRGTGPEPRTIDVWLRSSR